MPLLFLQLVVFLAVAGMAYSFAQLLARRRPALLAGGLLTPQEYQRSQTLYGRIKPLLAKMARGARRVPAFARAMDGAAMELPLRLARAGSPGNLSSDEFLMLRPFFALLIGIPLLVVMPETPFLALLGACMGLLLPELMLADYAQAQQAKLLRNLPDLLDTLSLMVGAGVDFERALDVYIATNPDNVLTEELNVVRSEIRLGVPRSQALLAMAERLDCIPLTNFAIQIAQSQKTGAAISDFLQIQSEELRLQRFQKAEEIGQKAPLKLLAPLLLLIFPNIFIVVFVPMLIQYLQGGGQ